MAYWFREIAGWILVLGGLWLIGIVVEFCRNRWILEAGILGVVSIFVFRGGIHLLKVAIAARICREAWVRDQKNGGMDGQKGKRGAFSRESLRPAGFSTSRD